MSDDDFYAPEIGIHTSGSRTIAWAGPNSRLKENMYVCPRCLTKFKEGLDTRHIDNCRLWFKTTVYRMFDKLVVHVGPESPEIEKLVCERLAKCSAIEQIYPHPVLSKNKWVRNGWHLHSFLLTDHEEIAAYIVIGRVQTMEQDEFGLWHQDIIADMFTVNYARRRGNMRFLLTTILKTMGHTLETIWFQEPSDHGEAFLDKMSSKMHLNYRTC